MSDITECSTQICRKFWKRVEIHHRMRELLEKFFKKKLAEWINFTLLQIYDFEDNMCLIICVWYGDNKDDA